MSLLGLASVAMSIGFSYGFCSLIGLSYGPLHNMIPFLLLGIGIDDMFVTMQCFNNLSPEEEAKPRTERFGLTMRRAGAAITITSLTDFLAFAVGGTTVRKLSGHDFLQLIKLLSKKIHTIRKLLP